MWCYVAVGESHRAPHVPVNTRFPRQVSAPTRRMVAVSPWCCAARHRAARSHSATLVRGPGSARPRWYSNQPRISPRTLTGTGGVSGSSLTPSRGPSRTSAATTTGPGGPRPQPLTAEADLAVSRRNRLWHIWRPLRHGRAWQVRLPYDQEGRRRRTARSRPIPGTRTGCRPRTRTSSTRPAYLHPVLIVFSDGLRTCLP